MPLQPGSRGYPNVKSISLIPNFCGTSPLPSMENQHDGIIGKTRFLDKAGRRNKNKAAGGLE